jgi:hypothetical protein
MGDSQSIKWALIVDRTAAFSKAFYCDNSTINRRSFVCGVDASLLPESGQHLGVKVLGKFWREAAYVGFS